jgi:hypothetical protein
MKHPGVILIQVIISAALATVVGSALIAAWMQINKAQITVDRYIDTYTRAILIHNQIERDFSGVFIPTLTTVPTEVTAQKTPQTSADSKKKSEELPKAFYSVSRNENLELLTFITSNPLQVYDGGKMGRVVPRIARIVYRLEADKEQPGSYILTRQEGTELDFNKYDLQNKNALRSYELARGIKSLSVEYEFLEQEESNKQDAAPKKQEKKYKVVKEWQKKAESENNHIVAPSLPTSLRIEIVLWDTAHKRENIFKFVYTTVTQIKQEQQPANTTPNKAPQPSTPTRR